MLYPEKLSAKKTDSIIKKAILISVAIEIILILINGLLTPQLRWARYCNIGIIYVWITVLYSLNRNKNTAGFLFFLMITLSILCVHIDFSMGFRGWSINKSIPTIAIITNISMLVLSLVSYNYKRYAFFQLLIVFTSFLPIVFIYENMVNDKTLSIAAFIISIINLTISLLFHFKDIKLELTRKFHV